MLLVSSKTTRVRAALMFIVYLDSNRECVLWITDRTLRLRRVVLLAPVTRGDERGLHKWPALHTQSLGHIVTVAEALRFDQRRSAERTPRFWDSVLAVRGVVRSGRGHGTAMDTFLNILSEFRVALEALRFGKFVLVAPITLGPKGNLDSRLALSADRFGEAVGAAETLGVNHLGIAEWTSFDFDLMLASSIRAHCGSLRS